MAGGVVRLAVYADFIGVGKRTLTTSITICFKTIY